MSRFEKIVRKTFPFLDYALFIVLFMLNMYLFAKFTNTVFVREGFFGFFVAVARYLFGDGERGPFIRDLVMVTCGTGLLISSWTLFIARKKRILALLFINSAVMFILFADLVYYRYFEDLVSVVVLTQIGQLGDLNESIKALFHKNDMIFLVEFLLTWAVGLFLYRSVSSQTVRYTYLPQPKTGYVLKFFSFAVASALGFFLIYYPINTLVKYGEGSVFKKALSAESVYKRTGLIGFHAFDAYQYVKGKLFSDHKITGGKAERDYMWFVEHDSGVEAETEYKGIAKGSNVIVIQVEALQNFVINRNINDQVITPHLNELVKESLYFDNFYHQAAQGRTSDAEFAVNTSLQPLVAGSVFVRFPDHTYEALPQILKENGYDTAAFHAFRAGFWNRNIMYRNLGYNRFISQHDFRNTESIGWGLNDVSFLNQSVIRMDSMEQPFYSFAVTLTSHHPYVLPEKYKTLRLEPYSDELFKNYIHAVHYVDTAIGQMIEQLKQSGLWDNSIVVFYGDHDSGLVTEHSQLPEFAVGSYDSLAFEKLKRSIPLIIHLPKGAKAATLHHPGGMTDVAPTLLHLLGVEKDIYYMTGKNLLAEGERVVPFRDGSVADGKHYYTAGSDGTLQGGACYNYSDSDSQSVDVGQCESIYEQALTILDVSDDVIYGNLLHQFTKESNKN